MKQPVLAGHSDPPLTLWKPGINLPEERYLTNIPDYIPCSRMVNSISITGNKEVEPESQKEPRKDNDFCVGAVARLLGEQMKLPQELSILQHYLRMLPNYISEALYSLQRTLGILFLIWSCLGFSQEYCSVRNVFSEYVHTWRMWPNTCTLACKLEF